MTAVRLLILTLVLAALTTTAVAHSHVHVNRADPFYCAVVKDSNGNPVETVCVPAAAPVAVSAGTAAA